MRLYGVRVKVVPRSRGNYPSQAEKYRDEIGRVLSYKFTSEGDVRLLLRIGVKLAVVWEDDIELFPEDVAEDETLNYPANRRVP